MPNTRKPRVRARMVREAVAALELFEAGAGQRLRERVPDASWQIIQNTLPLDWVALEHDRHIVTGFVERTRPR